MSIPTLRVAVAGIHSEICFQAHGSKNITTSNVSASPMAITAIR
jgi:hypothetical protein